MANKTITARSATYSGTIAGIKFTDGTATVDDSTTAGKAVLAFAARQKWAYGSTAAVNPTAAEGANVFDWTEAELRAYLTDAHVDFPTNASVTDLRAAVLDAFEVKAQGGSAANQSAGHTQGTMPPEGAPPVPGDNEDKASQWTTPLTGDVLDDVQPTVTTAPSAQTKAAGSTATFSVVASGTPAPTYQWERQAKGSGSYAPIAGATSASYTTPPVTIADNNNDRYRVVVSNSAGDVTTTGAQLTVTA